MTWTNTSGPKQFHNSQDGPLPQVGDRASARVSHAGKRNQNRISGSGNSGSTMGTGRRDGDVLHKIERMEEVDRQTHVSRPAQVNCKGVESEGHRRSRGSEGKC